VPAPSFTEVCAGEACLAQRGRRWQKQPKPQSIRSPMDRFLGRASTNFSAGPAAEPNPEGSGSAAALPDDLLKASAANGTSRTRLSTRLFRPKARGLAGGATSRDSRVSDTQPCTACTPNGTEMRTQFSSLTINALQATHCASRQRMTTKSG